MIEVRKNEALSGIEVIFDEKPAIFFKVGHDHSDVVFGSALLRLR